MVNFLRHKFPKIISLQFDIDKTDIIRVQFNNSHRDRRHIPRRSCISSVNPCPSVKNLFLKV